MICAGMWRGGDVRSVERNGGEGEMFVIRAVASARKPLVNLRVYQCHPERNSSSLLVRWFRCLQRVVVLGRVEVVLGLGEGDLVEVFGGGCVEERFGAALVVGALAEPGEIGLGDEGGGADGVVVLGDDEGALGDFVGLEQGEEIFGGDERLVGKVDEDGAGEGVVGECVFDAGAERGAHAALPERVDDDAQVEARQGVATGVRLVAEHDGHGEIRGQRGGGGVADERLATKGEELLADSHAGRAAGGEKD